MTALAQLAATPSLGMFTASLAVEPWNGPARTPPGAGRRGARNRTDAPPARGTIRNRVRAIDLLYPDEWAVAQSHGLAVSMGFASRRPRFITEGFNDTANHAALIAELEDAIPRAAGAGVAKLIVMSGNRRGGTRVHL